MNNLTNNNKPIQSVQLNLLNGQVELVLRSLELYGYNLEFMLDSSDSSNENKEEKLSLLKFTYEQVLATQAEQVNGKQNNKDNLSEIGKMLTNDINNTKNIINLKIV